MIGNPMANVLGNPLGNPLGLARAGADVSAIGTITTRTTGPAANEMIADGRQVLKAEYSELYSAIGDAYSPADFTNGFTSVAIPGTVAWNAVAYGNGIFVAVGNASVDLVSTDGGRSWASYPMPALNYGAIAYGNGLFVAIPRDTGSVCYTSPNGIDWTLRGLGVIGTWTAVAYGGGRFVAMGSSQITAYSFDAITWIAGGTTTIAPGPAAIAFGNSLFVAVYGSTSMATASSSPDGVTWTLRTLPQAATWLAIAYGNGLFIALSGSTTKPAISSDGVNWVYGPNDMGRRTNLAFARGWFISFFGPTTGFYRRSIDGIVWISSAEPPGGLNYVGAASDGESLVVIAKSSTTAIRTTILSAVNFAIPKLLTVDSRSTAYIKVS